MDRNYHTNADGCINAMRRIVDVSFDPLGTEVNTANLPFEPPVLTPTVTYHVVAAYDSVGNKMNLYLDGALVATNNMAAMI